MRLHVFICISSFIQQTKSWSEADHLQTKICAKAPIYATAMCMEMVAERAHYLSEYPLYYVLGYTRCTFTLEPGKKKYSSSFKHLLKLMEKMYFILTGNHFNILIH